LNQQIEINAKEYEENLGDDLTTANESGNNNNNNTSINTNVEKISSSKDIVMISGCKDNQTSADAYINKTAQGAMTWSFLETINKNPSLSWLDIVKNMRTLLKSNGYVQIPQLSSNKDLDIGNNFL
jgi:hypothetical protein